MNKETLVTLVCQNCGFETEKRSVMQKYCIPCSENKRIQAVNSYKEQNPELNLKSKKSILESVRLEDRGKEINKKTKRNIFWINDVDDCCNHIMRIAIPYTTNFSKNRIYSMAGRMGHVFLRQEVRKAKNDLIMRIKRSLGSEHRFYVGKVWLDILVQKPDNRSDAINVLDAIADAVKIAINVDDKYFAIRKLDWEIVKENPMIYVGIGQVNMEENFCCTYCGRVLSIKNKSAHRSTCVDCRFDGKSKKIKKRKEILT